jgi:hypothetical protein
MIKPKRRGLGRIASAYKFSAWKPLLCRSRRREEGNNKMDQEQKVVRMCDWIQLA